MRRKLARHLPAIRAPREFLRRSGPHRLRIEPLEPRALLAADMGLISGTVYGDRTGDGQTADDELLPGVMVELFRDGGDMAVGGDDMRVGSRTTDASGQYAFGDLAAGRYFVRQTTPDGYITRPGEDLVTVDIAEEAAAGTMGLAIDSFESAQSASAASNLETIDASNLADAAVLGGERDLFVELLAGMGTIELDSDFVDMGILQLSSSGTAVVLADVVWDGPDGDGSVVDTRGLGGIDLTDAGGNEMSALLLEAGADQVGSQITIQVFTDAANSSMAVIDVPDTGGLASETFCIRFADFAVATGSGADFADVGAIRLVLASGESAVDLQVALTGTVGPSVFDVDFANLPVDVDVAVTKADSGDPVVPGDEITYTLTVTNNGTSAVTGVVLTDMLPPEVTFISATSTQGEEPSEADGVVTADLGMLASGGTATVTIVVDTSETFRGTLTNTASIATIEMDAIPDNNTVTEETTVEPQTDLAITKTDNPDPVVPGETLTYTLQVTNNGPSNASGVVVTDTLPAGVTFVSATASQGDTPTAVEGVVTADLGDLAGEASAMVTIQVAVASSATGTLENAASVVSATNDPNPENNSIVESTALTPQVDLAITKADSSDPATAGEMLTYTLIVTNNGPSDATGVTVTDTLPEGVTFNSATAGQGDEPTAMEGTVTALLGDLAAGTSATVTIVVDVGPNTFGTITNMAAVTANEPERDETNNEVSEPTEVEIPPASLSGRVFVDFGNDGLFDGRDVPIPGVTITLTGMDITGAQIDRTTLTDENGRYEFIDLLPGTYRIEETQPGFFPDGQESVGTAGGNPLDNVFEMIELEGGVEGLDYNFAELVPTLSKRQFLASSG